MDEIQGTFKFSKKTINYLRFDVRFDRWGKGLIYLPIETKVIPDRFVFERKKRGKRNV